jgi:hypothetical protein
MEITYHLYERNTICSYSFVPAKRAGAGPGSEELYALVIPYFESLKIWIYCIYLEGATCHSSYRSALPNRPVQNDVVPLGSSVRLSTYFLVSKEFRTGKIKYY